MNLNLIFFEGILLVYEDSDGGWPLDLMQVRDPFIYHIYVLLN